MRLGCTRRAGDVQALQTPPSLPYRADVDGLRAVAVALVVGFHAFPTLVPGGFIGVDVFFVISGYLITAVLLRQVAHGHHGLGAFYARRARRILPALLLVLAASVAAGWALYVVFEFQRLGRHVAAGAGFVSNLLLWQESGYFDIDAKTKPLLHLWSLAVEEQFYIVWPAVLMLALHWRWPLRLVLSALVLCSLGYAQWALANAPEAAFYSPLARMWELLLGGLIALGAVHKRASRLLDAKSGLLCAAGLVLIGAAGLGLHARQAYPGLWALLPTLGAAMVIVARPQGWCSRRLLSAPPMVMLGRLSYPLYLWHWPLLVFPRIVLGHEPDRAGRVLAVVASLALAWLTWRWLERPLQRLPLRPVAAVLAAGCACGAVLGLQLAAGGVAPRHADPSLDAAMAAAADWDFPGALKPTRLGGIALLQSAPGAPRSVLWLGDSHVQQYGPRLAALAAMAPPEPVNSVVATSAGCPPIPGVFEDSPAHLGCAAYRDAALALAFSGLADTVVIGACWACFFIDEAGPAVPGHAYRYYLLDDARQVDLRDSAGPPLALARLEDLLRRLVAAKRRVYLLLDNPQGRAFDPMAGLTGDRLGQLALPPQPHTAPLSEEEARLEQALQALAVRTGAVAISPIAALCQRMACRRIQDDGQPLYKDTNHLRASFVRGNAGFIDVVLSPR